MLEAGGKDNHPWIRIPVGYLYCMGNPRTDWCLKTDVEAGLNGRALNYPRGRVLGGSSSINGMIYMRGHAADYDGWRQMGHIGWSWDDVLPYFLKSEDHVDGGDALHGSGGPLRVERQRLRWELLERFRDAVEQYGVARTPDFNRGDNDGSGYFESTQRRGPRWSASDAFLKPALARPNLRVVTGALVDRLEIAEGRVTAVHFTLGGENRLATARGEIVLAAGAIGSPVILQRSGIGDGAWLKQAEVATVHHLPGVGSNLQDHLQIRCAYRVTNEPTLNMRANSIIASTSLCGHFSVGAGLPSYDLRIAPSISISIATPDLSGNQPFIPQPRKAASATRLRFERA